MPLDPGTATGAAALVAIAADKVWAYFRGDLKKYVEKLNTVWTTLDVRTAKLNEDFVTMSAVVSKSHELLREHVTTIASTGERQIELLRELIGIVRDLQGDVTEMKLREQIKGGK